MISFFSFPSIIALILLIIDTLDVKQPIFVVWFPGNVRFAFAAREHVPGVAQNFFAICRLDSV